MRHAAGQAADGLHFLRLAKLFFELTALGDVFRDQFEDFFRFVGKAGGTAAQADGDGCAVFVLPLYFDAVEAAVAPILIGQAVDLLRVDVDLAASVERKDSSTAP